MADYMNKDEVIELCRVFEDRLEKLGYEFSLADDGFGHLYRTNSGDSVAETFGPLSELEWSTLN